MITLEEQIQLAKKEVARARKRMDERPNTDTRKAWNQALTWLNRLEKEKGGQP